METPHERLQLARQTAGYSSASAAAEAMGLSVATYVQHENGTRGLPAKRAERYARFFHTTPEWLLYGRGNPPQGGTPPSTMATVNRFVPIVGSVQAGVWQEIESDEFEARERIPVYLPGFDGAQLFSLRIRGPSMNQFYPDGSLVIVCPAIEIGIREGDHVIVRRQRGPLVETTIKEVSKTKGGVVLYPRSTDPNFQDPIRLSTNQDADDGPEIIGVVVASYNIRPVQSRPLLQL